MTVDWQQIWLWLPLILSGFKLAILMSAMSVALTVVVAIPLALMRMSKRAPLALTANIFVTVTRALPLYVFMLWFYYGLPLYLGILIPPLVAGVLILVVQFSSFQAEAYRSGLLTVSKGQTEAAMAVGLTKLQTFLSVVLPQAIRVAIPPTGNNLIAMFKATSVLSVIGVIEGTKIVDGVVGQTGMPLQFYTLLAILYVVGVGVMSLALSGYERSLRRRSVTQGIGESLWARLRGGSHTDYASSEIRGGISLGK